MTINELLQQKEMTKYALAKKSGIPWATLSDICSGKTDLTRCSVKTLQKLANALDISIDEAIKLKADVAVNKETGKPKDRTYLETNLSAHLQKAIDDYVEGEKQQVSYLDCLWGELSGSINADFWAGVISEEQANYLRKKYL